MPRGERHGDEREQLKVIEVYQARNVTEADMIKLLLNKYEIECIYSEFPLSSIRPVAIFTADSLASVRVYVRQDDAESARAIIEEYLKNRD